MLVGREREEQVVERLLDDARAGRSTTIAFVGEVGVGKSALLDHAAATCGMTVLRARGIESEAQLPFAGLLELLRPALGRLDQLPEPQRVALEVALALRPSGAHDRFAVGAATLSLLAACADDGPLLLLVDDAQWIDGSSADALVFALRRLVADPIAAVIAVRAGTESLIDGTDLPVHRMEGLDRRATAELVARQRAGASPLPEGVIDRLHRGTGGNPLALLELAHDPTIDSEPPVGAPLPVATRISRAYLERCATFSDRERDVLVLAAACDTGDLSTLARAAEVAGLDVTDLGASEAAGLVAIGDTVEFRHPLVRSSVYADAAIERRRLLHRALASALPDAEADRRAWHLAAAALGTDAPACSALEQAGRRARARSAYDVASQAFERASALAPDVGDRGALLLAAADSAWLGGQARRAVTLLDRADQGEAAPEVSIGVAQLRGHIAMRMGQLGDGLRTMLDGARRAADVDPDRAVVMLAEAVNATFYAGDAVAMRRTAERIPPLVGARSQRRTQFFAAMSQGMALIFGGEDERRGAALVRQAVALIEDSDELSGDPRLLAWAAMGPLWLREAEAGRSLVDRALDRARQQAAVGVLPFLLSHVAVEAMASDRWVEAEAAFHESIGLARETGQLTDLVFSLARLAWLEARQGREESCRDHAGEAQVLARELELGLSGIWLLGALGDLQLGAGDAASALGHYEAALVALEEGGVADVDVSPRPELVEVNLLLGRRPEALAHQAVYEDEAARKGQPWALARAGRGRGLLAPDDEIERHFEEALDRHARTPDLFETARTRLAYGSRLRRARQRVRAREQLQVAVELFDRLGAAPWSERAAQELAGTGARARRRDPSTRNQLTPQELQVAVLLGSGRTTREAAAAMFLSPKTIEYHLRSVYRKLGVNSRDELAAVMVGLRVDSRQAEHG